MIMNAMSSSVLVINSDLEIVFVNPAAEQLFGVSRAALSGAPLSELMPEDSPLLDRIRRVQIEGSSVSDYSVELPFMRETRHLLDLHVSPLSERPGDALVLLHPCSVAHRLNHQLSHRGRARSVAGLGATLAHEVKNPLSGIRGAAQLLEEGVDDEERPLIRLICDETDRICALVDQMEQFADMRPLERGPVNIYEVL
ncbi:MAG: two-component system sensor histidine kinase NtrB, partial [Geminicoccaceae bacterium]